MKTKSVWEGRMKFSHVGDSGHSVLTDASPEFGGEGKGSKPTELVLMGLSGCSGFDVTTMLTKMREKVTRFQIEVDADRNVAEPKRFTALRLLYRLEGEIKPANVEKAIRLSLDKYCSVSNSLNAEICFAYEVNGVRFPTADKYISRG